MDKASRRRNLVNALRNLSPDMKETLRRGKEDGRREMERPDFIWHLLLQSFATLGSSRGWDGLIGDRDNYNRVTYQALSRLEPTDRLEELQEVFRTAKIRYASRKAPLMARNYDLVLQMGGLENAKDLALSQPGRNAKIAFMKQFHGIGDKYARNIWMDAYHPDFLETVAIDERIKKVTEALGESFGLNEYEEHERYYQSIAHEAGIQAWDLDRLLYNHTVELLGAIGLGAVENLTEHVDDTESERTCHPYGFVHTLRVRYAEIDGQKIVYNAHYLTYVDLAITEYFRDLGIGFAEDEPGFDISLVKATLEYRRPARLDDLLDVRVSIVRLGNSSFTARFVVLPHGETDPALTRVEVEVIYVSYDAAKGAAVPIPPWVRGKIEAFEGRGS